ncbi:hypothetical protein [Kitasatospora kifunensis]|uniref:Secreted protein n=1 Tax=Kitasatospora kifunensis TaxID=58351 RepID=A0A7W7R5T0_KITKI|nr:hypothetical protein [Kitasatospora kifunensis]MBB4925881.1 hypothetical protein [Kitasatospora kifunensis]
MTRSKLVLGACAMAMTLAGGVGWAVQANADAATQKSEPAATRAIEGYEIIKLPNANVPNFRRQVVFCPAGKRVVGGGAEAQGDNSVLNGSFPTDDGRGWIGIGHQPGADSVGISVYAVCANV